MPLEATLRKKSCVTCGKVFKPNSARQKYCSEVCRQGVCVCGQCGKEFVRKKGTTGQYCSLECWYKAPGKKIYEERQCELCGKAFVPGSKTQAFCSAECANLGKRKEREHTHCLECGKPLPFKLSKRSIKYCSRTCALTGQSRQGITRAELGQRQAGPNGYVLVKVGKDYPGAFKNGWMLEHRYVMEQELERKLERYEHIHHKNGERSDNRPENLELWTVGEKDPPGQRQMDVVKHTIEGWTMEERKQLLTWLQGLVA